MPSKHCSFSRSRANTVSTVTHSASCAASRASSNAAWVGKNLNRFPIGLAQFGQRSIRASHCSGNMPCEPSSSSTNCLPFAKRGQQLRQTRSNASVIAGSFQVEPVDAAGYTARNLAGSANQSTFGFHAPTRRSQLQHESRHFCRRQGKEPWVAPAVVTIAPHSGRQELISSCPLRRQIAAHGLSRPLIKPCSRLLPETCRVLAILER